MNPLLVIPDALSRGFAGVQQGFFETLVQPLLYRLGMASYLSDAFDATGWLLVGLIQWMLLLVLIRPMEHWRPVEISPSSAIGRAHRDSSVKVDMVYTAIHRLGLFRVAMFFGLDPLWNSLFGQLAVWGWDGWHLDQAISDWWPGLTDTPMAGFLVYLLVFDLMNYGLHRAQHQFQWWWSLHALHHSQRHMTLWSDSRNHLLDSLLVDSAFVLLARVIGVPPGQFVALVALSQLIENLAHANVQLSFGPWGERLLVSPRFHRIHHAMGIGHESQGRGTLGGHNFAVLFPVWDVLFRTADFTSRLGPTGIRDQLPNEGGRDYGSGFWDQQWRGLLRLMGRA